MAKCKALTGSALKELNTLSWRHTHIGGDPRGWMDILEVDWTTGCRSPYMVKTFSFEQSEWILAITFLKIIVNKITFQSRMRVFIYAAMTFLLMWPDDLDIRIRPRYSQDALATKTGVSVSRVSKVGSRTAQTDRQTDRRRFGVNVARSPWSTKLLYAGPG